MRFLFFLFAVCLFYGCSDDHERYMEIEVIHPQITAIEKADERLTFSSEFTNDTLHCTIQSIYVEKGAAIYGLEAHRRGQELYINVSTTVSSADGFCLADTCFMPHEVTFDLVGLPHDTYELDLWFNYASQRLTINRD